MAENEANKQKSGAGLYIFLILLLIIALGVVYYLGFVKNNEKIQDVEAQKETLITKYNELEIKLEQSQKANKNVSEQANKNENGNTENTVVSDEEMFTKGNFNTYFIVNGNAYYTNKDTSYDVKKIEGVNGKVKRIQKMFLGSDMTCTIILITEDGKVYHFEETDNAPSNIAEYKAFKEYQIEKILDRIDVATEESPVPVYELKVLLKNGETKQLSRFNQ